MNDRTTPQEQLRFLAGGGAMGARLRAFDWAATPLGPPQGWPHALRAFTNLLLASGQPMFMAWGPQRIWFYNDAFTPILGHKHPHALGRPSAQVWAEAWGALQPMFDRVFAGEEVHIEGYSVGLDREGVVADAYFDFSYTPVQDDAGVVQGLFGVCTETTARVVAQRREVAARERQQRQFQQAPGFICILEGPDHVFTFANDTHRRLFDSAGWIGRPAREAFPVLVEQGFVALLDQVYASGQRYVGEGVPVRMPAAPGAPQQELLLDFIYAPVTDDAGRVTGIFCEGFDVTATRHAQERLRELNETLEQRVEERTRELARAQDALRQSQKMEAIGQLTGGIAHDFNNLLASIGGSLELLQRRLAPGGDEPNLRYIAMAQRAAQRAAALTQRLLAFSRRQTLDPRPTDLQQVVCGMEDLVRRSVGPTVEVEVQCEPRAWAIRVDASQLENALLNLCINARDAMAPAGGRLAIRTRNSHLNAEAARPLDLDAGDYALLEVEDSGAGMPPEVIERAFDPFFTTKPLGQGTGLGLSMVYGFVRQSGGQVRIQSELGRGTTLSLYLPRYAGAVEAVPPAPAIPATSGAGETLLVVDDEAGVRTVLAEVLELQGYRVLQADDGAAALRVLESEPRIDLLITDVGLPGGINGRQVADAARVQRRGLRVVFITGYAETAVLGAGQLEPGMAVVTKPFALAELGQRVRAMLDARA